PRIPTSCSAPAAPSLPLSSRVNMASPTSTGVCLRPCASSAVPPSGRPFDDREAREYTCEGLMNQTATPEKLARLEQLLERQDILDCMVRFSRGMDRFDRELFLSAFHADAVIAAGEFVGNPVALYDW